MASGRRIVLGITGSIAAVKSPALVRLLVEKKFDVTCVMSDSAQNFVAPLPLATFSGKPVFNGMFEERAFEMPHLKLAEESHLMIVAPASATALARFAHGLADDLVSLIYVSTTAPVIVAPAMHPTMWKHPATQENVRILKERGVIFTGPSIGPLADKTNGDGRMSEPERILDVIERTLKK